MRKTITYIILLVFFGSCSNYSKDEVNDFLLGGSFLLINEKQDTIQIELLENCVKTYSWNYRINEEWGINENDGEIIFYFNGHYFKIKAKNNNEIIFANNETEFKLHKIIDNEINIDLVKGKWIEEKYSSLLIDTFISPPPCPNLKNDTFLIPSVDFKDSIAIINDFCFQQKWIYKTNLKFGIIRFGEFCTSLDQWKIIKLTNDTMIVNMRYHENSEIKYEENKTYIKYGG